MLMNPKKSFLFFAEYYLALLTYSGIYLGLGYFGIASRARVTVIPPEEIPKLLLATALLNLLIFLGLAGFLQVLFHFSFVSLTLRRHSLLSSLTSIVWGVIVLLAISLFMSAVAFRIVGEQQTDQVISMMVQYFNKPLRLFLVAPTFMLVAAGIPEEVFRSYVLSFPAKAGGCIFALSTLLLSSLVFSLGHLYQGPAAVLQIFPVGIYLGYYYLRRRSLWENIWLHTLYNAAAVFLATYGF